MLEKRNATRRSRVSASLCSTDQSAVPLHFLVPGSMGSNQASRTLADESSTAPSTSELTPAASSAQQGDTIAAAAADVIIEVVDAPVAPATEPAELGECVICLGELAGDDSPTTTLICNHAFHTVCVDEWLSKDGRCPTCRRQIRVVAPPRQPFDPFINAQTHAAMASMTFMMLESRRLMMLATMEAALAVRRCGLASCSKRPSPDPFSTASTRSFLFLSRPCRRVAFCHTRFSSCHTSWT